MANPQPDKFFKISIELFDAIMRTHFPGTARQVFDYIIRMTYGYHVKFFETTHHKIANDLKLQRQRVSEAIWWLEKNKLINGTEKRSVLSRNNLTVLSIQKDYEQWGNGTEKRSDSETERKNVPSTERISVHIPIKDKRYRVGTKNNGTEKRSVYKPPNGEELKSNGYPWVDVSSWNDFIQHRKEIKKPLTALAVKKSLQLLSTYPTRQREIVDVSIRNSWQGLFAPKGSAKEAPSQPVKYNNPEEDRAKYGL